MQIQINLPGFCLSWTIVLTSLFLCNGSLYTQKSPIPFERITEAQGVPCPVRKIVQDSLGFIWLGTNEGLAKYDGKKFKLYQSARNDESSLSNNIINDVLVDHRNRIWVATNGGLCYYDYGEDRFLRIHLPDTLEALDLFRIHSLAIDDHNRIWFSTKTRIHLLSDQHVIMRTFKISDDPSIAVKSIYLDENDRLIIGTNKSNIWVWDICSNEKYTLDVHSPASRNLASSTTSRFILNPEKDGLLLGSWMGGLNKLVPNAFGSYEVVHCENNFTKDIRSNIVTGIGILNDDCWWVGTYGAGIFWYHPRKNEYFHQMQHDPENAFSLLDDYINDILVDKDGIVWVASNNGLSKYDRSSHQFSTVHIPISGDELSVYRIPYQIVEDLTDTSKQSYFITVPGLGLLKFYSEEHRFEIIGQLGEGERCELNYRIYEIHISGDSIFVLQNQNILVYQKSKGLCRVLALPSSCQFSSARKMVLDRQGHIWIATSTEGLVRLSRDGHFCEKFQYAPTSKADGIQDNTLLCLLIDHNGHVWLGSQNSGLSKFDPVEKRFTYFKHSKKVSQTLPDNSVFDLYEDAENMLWIATENGLTRLDTKTYKMKTFTSQEGLPSSTVISITPDFEDNLWLATSKGLCYFNQRDGSFHVYTQSDGLAGNRMDGAVCLSKDGTMLFSTNSKISMSHSKNSPTHKDALKVYITSLQVYGHEIPLKREKGVLAPVEIDYQRNIFSVEFVALNYSNSSRMNYAYKLEGENDDWIYTGNSSNANFSNLRGGNYTLHIKASNYDGQWVESPDRLEIRILPPFWKTNTFNAAWILVLLIIVLLYARLKYLESRHIQQLRMRIARDLHDEVGSSLSGIFLTSNIMIHNKLEQETQYKFLERIQLASKSAMDMMGEIIWSLQPHNDQIDKMIDRMRKYASEFLEAADISFEFNVEGAMSGRILPLDVRKDFLLVYKELLNNIAKHSKANFVSIIISGSQDLLAFKISDNGVGFDPTLIQRGNGLKNIQERTTSIQFTYNMETGPGKGTSVEMKWNANGK